MLRGLKQPLLPKNSQNWKVQKCVTDLAFICCNCPCGISQRFPTLQQMGQKAARHFQDLAQLVFFLSTELALLKSRPGTVCSGSWQSSPSSYRACCQQSVSSLCCAPQRKAATSTLLWKHKQISSTSRSKRLEKLIFGFVFLLLLTSGKAVTILLQLVMPKPTPYVSRICAAAHCFLLINMAK